MLDIFIIAVLITRIELKETYSGSEALTTEHNASRAHGAVARLPASNEVLDIRNIDSEQQSNHLTGLLHQYRARRASSIRVYVYNEI